MLIRHINMPSSWMAPTVWAPLAVLTVAGCGAGSEPLAETLEIGVVYEQQDLMVPESAQVSAEFGVTVTTSGNSCARFGRTDVESEPERTTVTPYDWWEYGGQPCEDAHFKRFQHEATLAIEQRGSHEVVAVGRLYGFPDSLVELRDTVTVY